MIKQVVVTDAWFEHEGVTLLHPALKPYETALLSMKQRWANVQNHTPLSYYASLAKIVPSLLVAELFDQLPANTKQVWIASPYHAKLTRSTLRVLPDAMLDWSAEQATQVCEVVNPLLAEDGLQLLAKHELLILVSDKVWDAAPTHFANVTGKALPDKHQSSKDMGYWMRMLSEVQMTLHQHMVFTVSGLQIHGLWFWGGETWEKSTDVQSLPHVATQDTYLKTVVGLLDKAMDAELIVSDAESLPMLLPTVLPEQWLLLGAGKSVRLKNNMLTSALSRAHKPKWKGL